MFKPSSTNFEHVRLTKYDFLNFYINKLFFPVRNFEEIAMFTFTQRKAE